MNHNWSVTFLGTSSGGGPSESRNCSSLVADVLGNGSLWMVDCAEGTLRQFALQPHRHQAYLNVNRLTKMFITHMHADHVMGIVPILRSILFPPTTMMDASRSTKPPRIEIYGPAGIRTFVRTILNMTLTRTSDRYVVHELLTPGDDVTSCVPEVMHSSEVAGRDIMCSDDAGIWMEIVKGNGTIGAVVVDAGRILHRDPCIGYIIREVSSPFRKLVILGDTHDPSALIPLATSASLLIHEATDAYIPRSIDPSARRSVETVEEKALARGHSVPAMAGAFARKIGANRLILNHIGGRFPAPRSNKGSEMRAVVMREIERQASAAWGMGQAVAASDFLQIVIPPTGSVKRKRGG